MTKKIVKKKKLTIKQARFLKEYFRTGNGTQAAMLAYDTNNPATAASIATENLIKLEDPVKVLMEAKGLSLGKLIDVVDGATIATKQEDLSGAKVPDHTVRLKAVSIASKWLGIDNNQQPKGSKVQVNILTNVQEQQKKYEIN